MGSHCFALMLTLFVSTLLTRRLLYFANIKQRNTCADQKNTEQQALWSSFTLQQDSDWNTHHGTYGAQ